MKTLSLLLLALPLFAGTQSVNTNAACVFQSTCPFGVLPNSTPFNAANSHVQRLEFRLHNSGGMPASYWANLGPTEIYSDGTNIILANWTGSAAGDTFGAPTPTTIQVGAVTDAEVRVMRDAVTTMTYVVQYCITATQVCKTATYPITAVGTATNWGTGGGGWWVGFGSGADFAWMRWFSTLVSPSTLIQNTNTGDVLDWEFESSLTDSVIGLAFTPAPAVTYTTTPVFNPVCIPLLQQAFKVGITGSITGSGLCQQLDGGTTLTPTWTYLGAGSDGVTQSLTFGSAGALTSSLSGYIKGSVNLNLHLVDGSTNSSDTVVHDGAVNVDANDVVQTGLGGLIDNVLGKMLRWSSPNNFVPFHDTQNFELASLQAGTLQANFSHYWDNTDAGTVSLSPTMTCNSYPAGQGLVGVGTSFTGYSVNDYYTIKWNGGANRTLAHVVAIFNNTCMEVSFNAVGGGTSNTSPWYGGTTESGLQAGKVTDVTSLGNWGTSQAVFPGNYYDGTKAFRALYERTGIDTFWSAYVYLAEAWRTNPCIDKGQAYAQNYNLAFVRRSESLEGYMMYASDPGNSALWGEIDLILQNNTLLLTAWRALPWTTSAQFLDQRDSGYSIEYNGLCAQHDVNAMQKAACKAETSLDIPYINTQQGAFNSGSQPGVIPFTSLLAGNGGPTQTNSVTVTMGSATLTCSSCTFTAAEFVPSTCPVNNVNCGAIVTYACSAFPATNSGFSSVYYPTYVSATQITLDRNYAEASSVGSNTCISISPAPYGVPGWVSQPFMSGIFGTGLREAALGIAVSDPTNSALSTATANALAAWQTTFGYSDPAHSGAGGMYFFQNALNCTYPTQSIYCTWQFAPSQSREDAPEVIRALTLDYLLVPTPTKLAFLRTLINQLFCPPSGYGSGVTCTSDGFYLSDLADGGSQMDGSAGNLHWLAFTFGWAMPLNAITELSLIAPTFRPVFGSGVAGGGVQ